MADTYSDADVKAFIQQTAAAGGGDKAIADAMDKYGVSSAQVARAMEVPESEVNARKTRAQATLVSGNQIADAGGIDAFREQYSAGPDTLGGGGQNAVVNSGLPSSITATGSGVTPGIAVPTAGVVTQPDTSLVVPNNPLGQLYPGGSQGDILAGSLANAYNATELREGQQYTPEKVADAGMTGTAQQYTSLGTAPTVTATTGTAPATVVSPTAPAAGEYDVTTATTSGSVQDAQAAQLTGAGISPEVRIDAPQGQLTAEAIAQAAQTEVQQEQLVSYQLGKLYESIQEGQPLPAWAAGPARAATQIMQKRGLGASSMAAAATAQAIMESGVPIAAADAAEYSKINLANLNARQQAVLQNANLVAGMDMANLDARMKAAVQNAQSFLAIDLKNLDNQQSTEVLNYQGRLQALFTDAAAENATQQFNAKSQQQVDEFFAELGVQVDNANANRTAAMEQFNVDQKNSIATFNASLEDSREKFNSTMQTQIDQSNVLWRRQIALVDTAAQNEANRQNAMNLLQVSQNALSALWQRYRDESSWLMQSTENSVQRAHQLALLEFEKNANVDMFGLESNYAATASLGNAALTGILGMVVS